MHKENLDLEILKKTKMPCQTSEPDLADWEKFIFKLKNPTCRSNDRPGREIC